MQNDLQRHPVTALEGARDMAHKAVQLITKAARANLKAVPDDSHSNLGWRNGLGMFVSQPLITSSGDVFVGLNVSRLALMIIIGDELGPSLDLAGVSDEETGMCLDGQLAVLSPVTRTEESSYERASPPSRTSARGCIMSARVDRSQQEDDPVFQMFQRPWEWPDSKWYVYEVMPKSEMRPIRCQWSALVFRVKDGTSESRFDDLGWHDSREDAWEYAERLMEPYLH